MVTGFNQCKTRCANECQGRRGKKERKKAGIRTTNIDIERKII